MMDLMQTPRMKNSPEELMLYTEAMEITLWVRSQFHIKRPVFQ